MPFFDHLVELRYRLIVIGVILLIAVVVVYPFEPLLLSWLIKPIKEFLPRGKMYIGGPWESFTFRFRVSMYAAVIVASPIILWQVLAFFLPALRPKERRWFFPTFFAVLALFILGNYFCWRYVLNPAIGWSVAQLAGDVELLPQAPLFLSGITLLLLGFGVAFQLPVIVFYLVAFGLVPYDSLRKHWRYVYIVLLVVAAGATPDWSPWVMGALGLILILLYEGSMLLARIVLRKRIQRNRDEELGIADDEEEGEG
jgi:sec-independent protein translocase protein TatC